MSGLRIGTRGSALALAQTKHVRALLGERSPELEVEIVVVRVSGDAWSAEAGARDARELDGPAAGDKSRWVDKIEDALIAGEIDLAVHSAKDVPGELAKGLSLLGAPARVDAQDVLCGGAHRPKGWVELDALPVGATIGTSSLRRTAQLRAAREDLRILAIAGNVDTRLRLLAQGAFDAIVLARAGLQRLGREDAVGAVLDPARFVPAPGQGALALQARTGDSRVGDAVAAILDGDASACLLAERALAGALNASCHTPLGAHAEPAGCGCLRLRAWVGLPDGSEWISDELPGGFYDPGELGRRVAERLTAAGAAELLRRAEEMAVEHA